MPTPSLSAVQADLAARKEIYLRQIDDGVNGLIRSGVVEQKSFEILIHVHQGMVAKKEIRHVL
jgi:hypothetical protein